MCTISYNYIGILPANLLYDVMNGKAAWSLMPLPKNIIILFYWTAPQCRPFLVCRRGYTAGKGLPALRTSPVNAQREQTRHLRERFCEDIDCHADKVGSQWQSLIGSPHHPVIARAFTPVAIQRVRQRGRQFKSRMTAHRNKKEEHRIYGTLLGAVRQIWTADLVITNDALYRLSYNSICFVPLAISFIIIAWTRKMSSIIFLNFEDFSDVIPLPVKPFFQAFCYRVSYQANNLQTHYKTCKG